MHNTENHIFSFFFDTLSKKLENQAVPGTPLSIQDKELLHRIIHVVKMHKGDRCIFFDYIINIHGSIQSISKTEVIVLVEKITQNSVISPHITLYLPLLKRANLEEAVYLATECGVSDIQLIITQKSQHRLSDHEIKRLKKIILSACEQAKYFNIPTLGIPKSLSDSVIFQKQSSGIRMYFDPSGINVLKKISAISNVQQEQFLLVIGPEGGLVREEIKLLNENKFVSCALTSTILRAKTAASLSIALLRLFR